SERARARAFLDLLSLKVSLSRETRHDLLDEEQRLRAQIEAARRTPADGSAADDGARLLEAARFAYDRFLDRLQREDAKQASLRAVDPLTLPQIQALLPAGTGLLEYLVTN